MKTIKNLSKGIKRRNSVLSRATASRKPRRWLNKKTKELGLLRSSMKKRSKSQLVIAAQDLLKSV